MESIFVPGQELTLLQAWQLLFAFLIGHCLADFALQGEYVARFKNRHVSAANGQGQPETVWPYLLTAHSLIHMGLVWIITGSFLLGLIEFALHWLIDFAKCERWSNYHVDQGLHILCKFLYVGAIWAAPGWWWVI